jgi:5-methylcytosine-specific restriction protein B
MVWIADIVDRLNGKLRERFGPHLQIGHSYFLRKDLSNVVLHRIWDYDIMPFLEDQLFGQEQELENFSLDRLRES